MLFLEELMGEPQFDPTDLFQTIEMRLVEFNLDATQIVLHLLQPSRPDDWDHRNRSLSQPCQRHLGRRSTAFSGHFLNRFRNGVRPWTGGAEL